MTDTSAITAAEWINAVHVLTFTVGPMETTEIRVGEKGYIKCRSSHWLVEHSRISKSDLIKLKNYMKLVGAC